MSRAESWELEVVQVGRHRFHWRAWHWPASWPYGNSGGETYPAVDWRAGGSARSYARAGRKAERAIADEQQRRAWADESRVRKYSRGAA